MFFWATSWFNPLFFACVFALDYELKERFPRHAKLRLFVNLMVFTSESDEIQNTSASASAVRQRFEYINSQK